MTTTDISTSIERMKSAIENYQENDKRAIIRVQSNTLMHLIRAFESNLEFLELRKHESLERNAAFGEVVESYRNLIRNTTNLAGTNKQTENAREPIHAMCEVIYDLNIEMESF